MKRPTVKNEAKTYAIKRLVRKGELLASDIMRATGCSKPLAIEAMSQIREDYRGATEKRGTKLFLLYTPSAWKEIASDLQLFSALNNGADEKETGLTTQSNQDQDSDLPIRFNRWTTGKITEGLMSALIFCFQQRTKLDHRASLNIEYVSMKLGDNAKWRCVAPVGLECVMEQWRLIAHDMQYYNIENPEQSLRTYVLARIVNHKISATPLPKKFRRADFNTIQSMVTVKLNSLLTHDQIKVINNELNIRENGSIQIENRMEFEFLRRFSNIPVTGDAVWPVVEQIGEKKCT